MLALLREDEDPNAARLPSIGCLPFSAASMLGLAYANVIKRLRVSIV